MCKHPFCSHQVTPFAWLSNKCDSFAQNLLYALQMCLLHANISTGWHRASGLQHIYFCKRIIVNISVDFFSCLIINFICVLLDFKLKDVNLLAISPDQMVAGNSSTFAQCPFLRQQCQETCPFHCALHCSRNKRHFLKVEQLLEQSMLQKQLHFVSEY